MCDYYDHVDDAEHNKNIIEKQLVNPMIRVCYEKYDIVCEISKFIPPENQNPRKL